MPDTVQCACCNAPIESESACECSKCERAICWDCMDGSRCKRCAPAQAPVGICDQPGCGRNAVAREMCGKHYQAWWKHGHPQARLRLRNASMQEGFDAFMPPSARIAGKCWIWRGCRRDDGRGILVASTKRLEAHRVAWLLLVGPIPEKAHLYRACPNAGCVNPEHYSRSQRDCWLRQNPTRTRSRQTLTKSPPRPSAG